MSNYVLLETENLVKTFGDFHAVNGLNLQVRAGEMVGLVGPDGAGKTTAIRLMCGVLQPTSGIVRVAGYEVPEQVEKARQQIGYLAQDPEVENVHTFGNFLHLRVSSAEGPLQRIPARLEAAGVLMRHLAPVPATLEDVFIHLIETEGEDYVRAIPSA